MGSTYSNIAEKDAAVRVAAQRAERERKTAKPVSDETRSARCRRLVDLASQAFGDYVAFQAIHAQLGKGLISAVGKADEARITDAAAKAVSNSLARYDRAVTKAYKEVCK